MEDKCLGHKGYIIDITLREKLNAKNITIPKKFRRRLCGVITRNNNNNKPTASSSQVVCNDHKVWLHRED
jgi:hypothetical protein